MKKNREKELLKNTAIIGIGKFSTQIVSFLLLPMYTSILSTSEYGIYDFIFTLSIFLTPVITLLMEESMFRFLIDSKSEEETNRIISNTLKFILFNSFIFTLLAIFIGNILNIPYLIITVIYILTAILASSKNSLIRGLGKIKFYTYINFISSFLNIVLNIIFIAVLKYGIYGLLYANIIANLIVFIYSCIKIRIWNYVNTEPVDNKIIKSMMKYSIPLVPNSLSWAVVNLSDRFVISFFLGSSSNGVYSTAYKFPNMMDSIYSFFYTAWKESSAKAINDSDMVVFFNKIFNLLSNIMFSVTMCIIGGMPIIFDFLIKGNYKNAYYYIPILVLSMYYNNMSGYFGGIFSGFKNTKIMGITTLFGAAANIIIDILLIKYIGLYAAAISTLVSCMIVYYYRKFETKKYLKLVRSTNVCGIIILFITILLYYINDNLIVKLINVFVIGLYCILINKDIINSITNKFKINKVNIK